MEGTAVVGFPEAVPIEEGVCELNDGATVAWDIIQQAYAVVHAVQTVVECSELRYEVTQYAAYQDRHTYITYQSGDLAGNIYKYNQACNEKSAAIKSALSYLKDDMKNMLGLAHIPEEFRPKVEAKSAPKRSLGIATFLGTTTNSTSYFDGACKYCMSETDLVAYLRGVYDGQKVINTSLPEFDQSCIQKTPELERLYTGELQSRLTKIMVGYQMGLQQSTEEVLQLDDLVYGALKNCTGIEQMEFESRVKPVVNGTKWVFDNEDGMQIDLAMIPQMSSLIYTEYLDSQSEGKTNSTLMYELGQQLGLGQKLFATRAAKVPPTDYTGLYIGVGVAAIGLLGLAGYCALKKRQRKHVFNAEVTLDATQDDDNTRALNNLST